MFFNYYVQCSFTIMSNVLFPHDANSLKKLLHRVQIELVIVHKEDVRAGTLLILILVQLKSIVSLDF